MTLLTVRRCGLNPEYWGLPKISGQCFFMAHTLKRLGLRNQSKLTRRERDGYKKSGEKEVCPTALQGNKQMARLNP